MSGRVLPNGCVLQKRQALKSTKDILIDHGLGRTLLGKDRLQDHLIDCVPSHAHEIGDGALLTYAVDTTLGLIEILPAVVVTMEYGDIGMGPGMTEFGAGRVSDHDAVLFCEKGVDAGVQLVAQMGQTIDQLAQVIDESAQSAAQMVAGGQQQTSGMEQVTVAMQSINQVTVQTMASTRQAERSAQELNDLARSLSEIVDRYQV